MGWRPFSKESKAALPPTSIIYSPESSTSSSASSPSIDLFDDPLTPDMPSTSPIDITRNSSSSPSSQGQKNPVIHFDDPDSRTSAMMSGTAYDSGMGRGRENSFAGGAKPISMNNPNRNIDSRQRRESLAGSLVQGMSWGGVSVGSWIRDEYVTIHTVRDTDDRMIVSSLELRAWNFESRVYRPNYVVSATVHYIVLTC